MGQGRGIINSKEKKFIGGNWGHPRKYTKRKTKIPDPLIQEDRHKGMKRKRKKKSPYIWVGDLCPFCNQELPVDKTVKKEDHPLMFCKDPRVKECPNCKAKAIEKGCPCCHRNTWINIDGVLSHGEKRMLSCGFTGRKKLDNPCNL